MTTAGYIFLIAFWGLVIGLNAFCYGKLLKKRDPSKPS